MLVSLTFVAFAVAIAFAAVIGSTPERYGALVIATGIALSIIRRLVFGSHLEHFDASGLTIDLALFGGFGAIAFCAWRIWPLWAASLQLITIMAHLTRVLMLPVPPMVYAIMRSAPSYLEIIVLVLGTVHFRRLKRSGHNIPSWRNWSDRSPRKVRRP